MTKPFRITDLLDVLIRLEERGRAFYGNLAAKTRSDRARDLFTLLSDEECQHEALYRDLKKAWRTPPRLREHPTRPVTWTPSSGRASPSRRSNPS